MAVRSEMMIAARVGIVLVSLAIAAAAFVHAASENEAFSVGPGASERFGLDGHVAAAIVDSGFAAEMLSRQDQAQGEFPRLSESLVALARESFSVNPLEVSALRTIALGSMLHDDEDRARRTMRLAAQISKRDSITNLWLAQDYGRSGDIDKVMETFDQALRTSRRAREYAMKPVVDSLVAEESYVPLGELLVARPEWEPDFWRELASNPVGLANSANFIRGSEITVDRIQNRALLYANLKNARLYETLFDLASLDSQAKTGSDALAEGKFVTAEDGNPLGWTLRSQGGFVARVHEKTGELQIDARSGSFGLAADRIVRGEASYRLAFTLAEPISENARAELVARCTDGSNEELASLPVPPGERSGELVFSAVGCSFVSLDLSFAVDPGRRDALIRFANITLEPA